MNYAIPIDNLIKLVLNQLNSLFLSENDDQETLSACLAKTLEKCETNFSSSFRKGFNIDGEAQFNPYNSNQYCIFLYYFSRTVFLEGNRGHLADRLYYLNKALNSVDLFYEIELPDHFVIDHPVGSVIGRAKIGDYFSFSQNCTIGNNRGIYPRIGKNVHMYAGSMLLGECEIGNNVIISAGAIIIDTDIPPDSIVFQREKTVTIKNRDSDYFEQKVGRYVA